MASSKHTHKIMFIISVMRYVKVTQTEMQDNLL